jgi:hypothetical protein
MRRASNSGVKTIQLTFKAIYSYLMSIYQDDIQHINFNKLDQIVVDQKKNLSMFEIVVNST